MTKRWDDGGRAKVIGAARALFQQRGFHQTAMAELSKQSGVSVGQIYRLFNSKSEMITAIVQEDAAVRTAELAKIRDDVASGRLDTLGGFRKTVLDVLNEGREALTFEIRAEGYRNRDVGNAIAMLCERFRAMIGEIIAVTWPDLCAIRRAAAEEVLLALLFGLGHRALTHPELTIDETADQVAAMIVAMLEA